MTADGFASLLRARRIGRGRWVAKCPAHPDKSPSLSIAIGKRSPIVFKCMSQGCSADSILEAMGLSWRDILGDKRITRQELRQLEAKRKKEEMERKREGYKKRSLVNQCRYWEDRYLALARELATNDNDKTARLFHSALDRFRSLEAQVEPILHPKRHHESTARTDARPTRRLPVAADYISKYFPPRTAHGHDALRGVHGG